MRFCFINLVDCIFNIRGQAIVCQIILGQAIISQNIAGSVLISQIIVG